MSKQAIDFRIPMPDVDQRLFIIPTCHDEWKAIVNATGFIMLVLPEHDFSFIAVLHVPLIEVAIYDLSHWLGESSKDLTFRVGTDHRQRNLAQKNPTVSNTELSNSCKFPFSDSK